MASFLFDRKKKKKPGILSAGVHQQSMAYGTILLSPSPIETVAHVMGKSMLTLVAINIRLATQECPFSTTSCVINLPIFLRTPGTAMSPVFVFAWRRMPISLRTRHDLSYDSPI